MNRVAVMRSLQLPVAAVGRRMRFAGLSQGHCRRWAGEAARPPDPSADVEPEGGDEHGPDDGRVDEDADGDGDADLGVGDQWQ
jgi:hypothetical protein